MTELLRVTGLTKQFAARHGKAGIRAVDGVDLTLRNGETLGVVGESGCGKSTLGRAILRLVEPTSGEVVFDGADLLSLGPAALRAKRRDMQMIFQDPFASLDPRLNVGAIVAEPLVIHRIGDRASRRQAVLDLLETVGLDPDAASLPRLIIADEPVSALDVSIQSQILNLMVELRQRFGLSYIFISHDLAVVEHISDTVAVMYLGRIVETAATEELFARPSHPYTEALISAVPQTEPAQRSARVVLKGEMPDPEKPPPGCPFHPRCHKAMELCGSTTPSDVDIGSEGRPHLVRCHLY
jgi:oligopeptide/dipeptide ABC transporter ATP-binding protein